MIETQDSVTDWTRRTFPRQPGEIRIRLRALLEEVVECCHAGLMPIDVIENTVARVLAKCMEEEDIDLQAEMADVQLCLWALASETANDLSALVNDKMAINRARPKSYYDAKQVEKRERGIL